MPVAGRSAWIIGAGYVLLLVGVTAALFLMRDYALNAIDTDASRVAWEQWREAARQQAAGDGPVSRRPPEAPEPPTVMLLRDHFASCLAMALILASVLYATLAFFIRGVVAGARYEPELRRPEPEHPPDAP